MAKSGVQIPGDLNPRTPTTPKHQKDWNETETFLITIPTKSSRQSQTSQVFTRQHQIPRMHHFSNHHVIKSSNTMQSKQFRCAGETALTRARSPTRNHLQNELRPALSASLSSPRARASLYYPLFSDFKTVPKSLNI